MIVVLASRYDAVAQTLVARWLLYQAALLTCDDLSVCGWRDFLGNARASTMTVGGREVTLEEINGVLTRLPSIFENELVSIVPADRAYVAAEMTAFLISWLFRLTCPVLNRPTPTSLSGPYWRREQWTYVAAQLGISVRPVRRHVALASSTVQTPLEVEEASAVTVTVIGENCLGCVDELLKRHARRLAQAANVDLLAVRFSSSTPDAVFLGADLWPDLSSDELADAVIAYFDSTQP